MRHPSFHTAKSDINVTPYIDILWVVLIIFMVIQPVSQHDLKARVPDEPDHQGHTTGGRHIVVSIEESGEISVNGLESSYSVLGTQVYDILARRADKRLFVRGANTMPFGDVVHVIDIAKGAGASDVGLLGYD